ncbi:hypothetical protein GS905_25515 [Rhodococcus hoagii]|nr:hypothetical protein [Prescottella equi]
MHATYYAVGGSRPGIACMAVDGTTQNGDHQPATRPPPGSSGTTACPPTPHAPFAAAPSSSPDSTANPRPIPRATAHDLAALIGDKIATVPDRTPIAV